MNIYQAPTEFVGKYTKYIDSCPSTNEWALQETLKLDLPEGFAWIAGYQTAGKGQRGNQWHAAPNENLLMSFLFKPDHALLPDQFYLSKAIANGIIDGLQQWSMNQTKEQLPLAIKWPNDIYLADKKIGGILIESNFQSGKWSFSIVGIGLNINQLCFENLRATSLRTYLESPLHINLPDIFHSISTAIESNYIQFCARKKKDIDQKYHALLYRKNEWHTFSDTQGEFKGKIISVDARGYIHIEKPTGLNKYDLKEVSFIFAENQ